MIKTNVIWYLWCCVFVFCFFFNFAVKSSLCRAQPSGALHLPKPAVQSDGISCVKGTDWQGFKGDAVAAEKQLLSHQGKRWGQITLWKMTFLVGRTGTLVPTEGSPHPESSVLGSGVFASSKFPAEGGERLSPSELPPQHRVQRAAPRVRCFLERKTSSAVLSVTSLNATMAASLSFQKWAPRWFGNTKFWITAASC